MTYYFLDSSALIYAYVGGFDGVRTLLARSRSGADGPRLVVCDLAFLEAVRYLVDRHEAGRIAAPTLSTAVQRLQVDFSKGSSPFMIVEASGVTSHAYDWMQLFRISTPAAVAIAAALAARTSLPPDSELYVISADEDQIAAAQAEGFQVLRPYQVDN